MYKLFRRFPESRENKHFFYIQRINININNKGRINNFFHHLFSSYNKKWYNLVENLFLHLNRSSIMFFSIVLSLLLPLPQGHLGVTIPQTPKEANLDSYSWITSAAFKGFFQNLVAWCCVGTWLQLKRWLMSCVGVCYAWWALMSCVGMCIMHGDHCSL